MKIRVRFQFHGKGPCRDDVWSGLDLNVDCTISDFAKIFKGICPDIPDNFVQEDNAVQVEMLQVSAGLIANLCILFAICASTHIRVV